jgi:hypothetical protein
MTLAVELAPLERAYNADSAPAIAPIDSTIVPLDFASKVSSIQGVSLHLVGQGTSRTLLQGQMGCPLSGGCPESSDFLGTLGIAGTLTRGGGLSASFPGLSGPFDLEMPFDLEVPILPGAPPLPIDYSFLLKPGADITFSLEPQVAFLSVFSPSSLPSPPATIDQAFLIVTGTPVPEPCTGLLMMAGVLGLAIKRRGL